MKTVLYLATLSASLVAIGTTVGVATAGVAATSPDSTQSQDLLASEDATVTRTPGLDRSAAIGVTRVRTITGDSVVAPPQSEPHRSSGLIAGVDADWNNFGGNAKRNGRASVAGPSAATLLWENSDDYSIIAWHPVTAGDRVFAIRESGFPGTLANDRLVAYDLNSGAELWRITVPYGGDPAEEWIAYVAGANNDHVYAARGGSGRTTPVYAFDVATGALAWASTHETVAGPQDGIVFAPNGDLLVGDFSNIARLSALDGSTVWSTSRSCPVSGNCGCAINGDGVFIDEPAAGGNVVAKYDLATGVFQYETPMMPGFTAQNAPFVSSDGSTVYFARSQNNAAVDFLYAFEDTGVALTEQWHRPVRWTTSHDHGLAADGSIYTFLPGNEFVRLDAATGDVLDTAGILEPIGTSNLSPRTAVGSNGTVYISNGWGSTPASNGRIWAFPEDLSSTLFTLNLDRQNSGGPSLGASGTLVVADRTSVRAYRTSAPCLADIDDSGDVGFFDLLAVLGNWGAIGGPEDLDQSGTVDFADLLLVLGAWGPCPA